MTISKEILVKLRIFAQDATFVKNEQRADFLEAAHKVFKFVGGGSIDAACTGQWFYWSATKAVQALAVELVTNGAVFVPDEQRGAFLRSCKVCGGALGNGGQWFYI